jgi:16S rRNA (cytosine967-C5)-methyltransferase
MRMPIAARDCAASVLARVEADGAFAAAALDAALRRAALDARDRALATELVYGVLRTAPALDKALGAQARDGVVSLRRLDALTRATLRVAAYQLLALDRVPPRAAVDSAVASVRRARTPRLAGFVNAVLRRLAASRPSSLPADARVALALQAFPGPARTRMAAVLGEAGVEAHLRATFADERAVTLRIDPRVASRDAVVSRLRSELPDAMVFPGRLSPFAVRVAGGGDPAGWSVLREGVAALQEEGAQAVVAMAGVAPGQRVLEVCAGRGGKSATAALWMEGRGVLHAVDLYPEKLTRLRDTLGGMGFGEALRVETFAADVTRGFGQLPAGTYDVVIVDAPCSGLGTVGHRPDVLWRLRGEDAWAGLVATQEGILARAASRVAPGGTLLYAVCTLDTEEGDGVVQRFLARERDFVPARGDPKRVPERLLEARVVLDAATDGTDGFMMWRLRRT